VNLNLFGASLPIQSEGSARPARWGAKAPTPGNEQPRGYEPPRGSAGPFRQADGAILHRSHQLERRTNHHAMPASSAVQAASAPRNRP
jgi:hypothetical protein